MSIRGLFATDAKTEREGVWLNYGEFQIRAARAGGSNKKYQKTLEELSRSHRRAIELGIMDNDVAQDILREVYAKSVITGWQTKQDEEWVDGILLDEDIIPFTRENVVAAFRAVPDLFEAVQADASSIALYRAGLREEASGN